MTYPSARKKSWVINFILSLYNFIVENNNDDNFASMIENKVQVWAIQYENVNFKQGKAVYVLSLAK